MNLWNHIESYITPLGFIFGCLSFMFIIFFLLFLLLKALYFSIKGIWENYRSSKEKKGIERKFYEELRNEIQKVKDGGTRNTVFEDDSIHDLLEPLLKPIREEILDQRDKINILEHKLNTLIKNKNSDVPISKVIHRAPFGKALSDSQKAKVEDLWNNWNHKKMNFAEIADAVGVSYRNVYNHLKYSKLYYPKKSAFKGTDKKK